jgi:malonyl-CoA O-methyltransferase
MAAPPPSAERPLDSVAARASLRRMRALDEAPWLHREVARRMGERLALIRLQPTRIVEWWGGLGGGSEVLDAAYPKAERRIVEPDPEWVAKTRAAIARPWWSAARWSRGAVTVQEESAPIEAGAGLVWSNMSLHLVKDPPALFERWETILGADGFVMFSCLGPDTLRALRELYARAGWPSPAADFVDMHDFGDMMIGAGFADPVMDQETLTLRWDSAEALLAELRSLGGNTAPDRFAGLRSPRWRARLVNELEAMRGADGKIGLGFEVAYGHAFKAAPRAARPVATTVTLDEMRQKIRARRPSGSDPD